MGKVGTRNSVSQLDSLSGHLVDRLPRNLGLDDLRSASFTNLVGRKIVVVIGSRKLLKATENDLVQWLIRQVCYQRAAV